MRLFAYMLDLHENSFKNEHFFSILVVMNDANSQHVLKIRFTFQCDHRLADDKLILELVWYPKKIAISFPKSVLGMEYYHWK